MLITKDVRAKTLIILKLFRPKFLKIFNSSLSNKFRKKTWVVIRNIKGNISKITDGMFKNVKKIGIKISDVWSLKKLISSKIFNMNTNAKKINETLTNEIKKLLIIYKLYVFIIII